MGFPEQPESGWGKMNRRKILIAVFALVLAVLVGICFGTYRELVSARKLLHMANEIDGEYRYLGRREEVEESDLSRYIVAEENADVDSGDRDFYRQRLSLTDSGWEDFIRDIDRYQIHELEFSLYNGSDEPIRDIWLYSDHPEIVVQYDILYFKPVYVAPHAEFTARFHVYIRVDGESGGNAREVLEDGAMRYSIKTDYGTCQKPAQFRA